MKLRLRRSDVTYSFSRAKRTSLAEGKHHAHRAHHVPRQRNTSLKKTLLLKDKSAFFDGGNAVFAPQAAQIRRLQSTQPIPKERAATRAARSFIRLPESQVLLPARQTGCSKVIDRFCYTAGQIWLRNRLPAGHIISVLLNICRSIPNNLNVRSVVGKQSGTCDFFIQIF